MTEMAFLCKKCRKAFRKDMGHYEDSDEYCPHCDNHYVRLCSLPRSARRRRATCARRRGWSEMHSS